ncbi:MAG: methylenetetrahydrofolate reductase [NAD(P)H] [Bacteroidales bacterium]|nr:methylenetetrahydrofolate reductase [NAD(P)H] [Bacteroidales bacterium]
MKITDIFKNQERTFSFEFFPPNSEISAVDFGINVGQLMRLSPSFVTVTYGAGGSTQERTFALVDYLQNKVGFTTAAHYTCVNSDRDKIIRDLNHLKSINIKNLMLLRGDPPKGDQKFEAPKNGFNHASDLIEFVHQQYQFCNAGACYVEKHPEAATLEQDLNNVKKKVDAGAEFLITQLFFNNEYYFNYVEQARKMGITSRIIPGIIPITAYRQIERFTQMSGTNIPQEFIAQLEVNKNNPGKTYNIGIEYTINQCRELLAKGAPGIHFYTLNKSRATIEIFESL